MISKMYATTMLVACLALAIPAVADTGATVIPDVVYGHKDGMALTFDVFKPAGKANGGGVLFMVSGGWVSRWAPPERTQRYFKSLLDEGFTAFAIRHGSSPRYKVPDAYAGVERAVRYIRLHAEEFGVDPERLGVFGGSAGGHLSLLLGLDSDEGDPKARDEVLRQSSRVAAVVAWFPPVDLREFVGPSDRFPALDFDPSLSESVSPILYVSADDPPTLLIHGDADTLVPLKNSEDMYAEFGKHDVASELVVIEGGDHGFTESEDRDRARREMSKWFVKHLASQ